MSDDMILSAEALEPARQFVGFVKRNTDTQGVQRNSAVDLIERLLDSHEALRARLVQAERERDEWKARFDSAWADMRRAVAAGPEARVATLEAALRSLDALMDAPVYASREALDQWRSLIVAALGGQEATPPEPDEEYRAWQRASEAPTVYSQPLPASATQGEGDTDE